MDTQKEPCGILHPGPKADFSHALKLQGIFNARDLGGYQTMDGHTVKFGRLLRTGKLFSATEEDKKCLFRSYGVSVAVDLRGTQEVRKAPDPDEPGFQSIHVPILPEAWEKAGLETKNTSDDKIGSFERFFATPKNGIQGLMEEVESLGDVETQMRGIYCEMVENEVCQKGYRRFFEILLQQQGGPFLWHCTGGKDRTGIGAILLLSVLGVDRETILQDYLLTNFFVKDRADQTAQHATQNGASKELAEQIRMLLQVKKEWGKVVLTAIEKGYGTVESYLEQALFISREEQQALRRWYLE